jgi:sugar phosphate isomerase/epimerase
MERLEYDLMLRWFVGIGAGKRMGTVVDATRQVGRHAADEGIELAIELLLFEFGFMNTLDAVEHLLDGAASPM